MSWYNMKCDQCGYAKEEKRSITVGPRKKCPKCKAVEPVFHQIYEAPIVIDRVIRTVGQQAEYNARKMGKEKVAEKTEQLKRGYNRRKGNLPAGAKRVETPTENPFWREGNGGKPLDLKKIKNVKKYIMSGDKN